MEREIFEEAIRIVDRESNQDDVALTFVAADGWHPGVIGIVASRLRERYRKPALVIGVDRAANIGKGSGRSQAGVNLGRAVQAAFDEGLLLAGGGHAMAAGLSVRPDTIPDLRAFLNERLALETQAATAEDGLDIPDHDRRADRGLYNHSGLAVRPETPSRRRGQCAGLGRWRCVAAMSAVTLTDGRADV